MKATDVLEKAAGHMRDRAATYDKPEGERSMARTVAAFNAITGRDLTTAEGWAFMLLLKQVRVFQNPAKPHQDSLEDGVAYAALLAEEMLSAKQPEQMKLGLEESTAEVVKDCGTCRHANPYNGRCRLNYKAADLCVIEAYSEWTPKEVPPVGVKKSCDTCGHADSYNGACRLDYRRANACSSGGYPEWTPES